jgi:Family of unknown function (DUF6299)
LIGTKPKLLLVAAIATVALVASATSASAAVTTFSVNDRATIELDGSALVVTGLVQCTFGDTVFISSDVFQSKGQLFAEGFGSTGAITCTGGLQTWSVAVSAAIGSYKPGQASSLTSAFDNTDFTSASVNQTMHLGK